MLWKGLLLVYADLKRHSYSYCAAFPYLKLPQSCGVLRCQPLNAAYPDAAPAMIEALGQQHDWPVLISVGGAASSNQQVPPFRHVCVMTVLHQATKNTAARCVVIVAKGSLAQNWAGGIVVVLTS